MEEDFIQHFNLDEIPYDEHKEYDVSFGEYYDANQNVKEYTTPAFIASDERLQNLIKIILDDAIANKSTDIQITNLSNQIGIVRYRVGEEMYSARKLHGTAVRGLAIVIKKYSNLNIDLEGYRQDGRFSHTYMGKIYHMRTSILPTIYGESISIRVLYNERLDTNINSLGLPDQVLHTFDRVLNLKEGLVLLTGATGSGKTTTMYTGIGHIQEQSAYTKNIITIEDPVEYIIPGALQSPVNLTKGYTFAEGLRTAFRQNPDVILIGEINDPDTASTAVRASTSGHLVFSTVHTNSVLTVPLALEQYGVSKYNLNSALTLVLNQKLPNKLCDHCKEKKFVTMDDMNWISRLGISEELLELYVPVGCDYCGHTGYRGRVLVVSMLDANGIYKRIADDGQKSVLEIDELLRTTERSNYYSLATDIYRHLKQGNIDLMTAKSLLREEVQ